MKQWYRIKAQKNRTAEIYIYEQIGEDWWSGEGVSAKKFITDLNKLDVDIIDLYINSPGGSVFDGNSIYNALNRHKAAINVTVDGIAASIASVVAMAGDTITMPQNAMMMIHNPSGMVQGTAKDMIKMAEALDKVKVGILGAYMTRAAIEEDDVSDMMAEETWLTAQDALDYGFADKVVDPVKMAACFDGLANFKNVPDFLSTTTNKTKTGSVVGNAGSREETKMEITLELIQSKYPAIVAEILKTVDLAYVQAHCPQIVDVVQQDGAHKERDRIQAVKAQSMPDHEALIETLMFDGRTSGEQAAVQVLAAEKEMRAQALKDQQNDAPPVLKQPPDGDDTAADVDKNLPLDKRCRAKWDKDVKLRVEFSDDFEAYLAYEKAMAAGQVKELGKK